MFGKMEYAPLSDYEPLVEAEPLKYSTTFKNCAGTRNYGVTVKEVGSGNSQKFRIFLYRLDKPDRIYATTVSAHTNVFNLYSLRSRKVSTDNVYWPEFFEQAFVEKCYEVSIIFNDFFYDATMSFKKGPKKINLHFDKISRKTLGQETFTAVQELNEKFDGLENELKTKIQENQQLKEEILKMTNHFVEVNTNTLIDVD